MKALPAAAAALLLLLAVSLHALELKQGNLKLDLAEDTGRFTLYYLENPAKDQYVPLFFSDDPRTSVLTLMQDGKLYRLGDSSAFRMSVEHQGDTAAFVWKSSTLNVTEEFRFTSSAGASAVDGIIITVTIRNLSKDRSTAGARYLLDTTLGEHSSAHFHTPAEGPVRHESGIKPSISDAWVLSEAAEDSKVGLQIMIFGSGITTPDRVILANWKRLNESPWDFDVSTSRDFSLLPYSINDSAVALYYSPQSLSPGASRTITLALGNKNLAGFTGTPSLPSPHTSIAPAAQPQPSAQPQTTPGASSGALAQPNNNVVNNAGAQSGGGELDQDYQKATELLDRINQLLAQPPGSVSQDQINALKQELQQLEARKSNYAK